MSEPITPRGGVDISNHDEEIQEAFRDYSQYLVGLGLLVEPEDNTPSTDCYFYSGFVMQFGHHWYWVTAGHVMEAIEPHIASSIAKRFRLIDSYGFGADRSNGVPFDYENAWRFHVYNEAEGLDFGAVEIAPFYRRTLESNAVAVVKKQHWRRLNPASYKSFVLTGLAQDTIERRKSYQKDHYVVHGKPLPSMVLADQIPVPDRAQLRYNRIAGRISKNWPDGSIVGMSGGPIFGVPQNNRRSPIIALQSTWLTDDRIALACPINVFGPLIEERIRGRTK